jgi:hypothetical protein
LDERVEQDVLNRYENACNEAKQMRTEYINLSKKYSTDSEKYEQYLDVR